MCFTHPLTRVVLTSRPWIRGQKSPIEPFPFLRRIIQRTRKTVRDRMVSILITAFVLVFAILLLSGIGFYFWRKSVPDSSERVLPPSPDFHGLFGEHPTNTELKTQEDLERAARVETSLVNRARAGEKSALNDANESSDAQLYDRILNEFVQQIDSDAALLSLMSFVAQNDLRVNVPLAEAAIASWKASPSREGTAKALHFAALSDDAGLYGETVELTLKFWREGKLANVSTEELRALFDGEFWILSSRSRSSGAGFVLKQTLADARRELEAPSVRSPRVSKGSQPQEALPDGRPSDTT
jgi:hypothetical protein